MYLHWQSINVKVSPAPACRCKNYQLSPGEPSSHEYTKPSNALRGNIALHIVHNLNAEIYAFDIHNLCKHTIWSRVPISLPWTSNLANSLQACGW